MYHLIIESVTFPALFGALLLFLELGRRLRWARLRTEPESGGKGLEAIEGAVFGLMGLMIAFTFAGAASRFDWRRQLVAEEANCIGTAYLRIDFLPDIFQTPLREKFRQYVDGRLEMYAALPDVDAAKEAYARTAELQGEIWKEARAAVNAAPDTKPALLFIPSLCPGKHAVVAFYLSLCYNCRIRT